MYEFSALFFAPVISAYLLGSIPFGLLLTRFFLKTDVRALGSGNIGATNVLRTGNKKIALATLLLDAGKGALPLFLFPTFSPLWLIGAVVSGHVFPLWLKFKGGKGVATALGATLAAFPLIGAMISSVWLIVAYVGQFSSLAALIGFMSGALAAWFTYPSTTGIFFTGLWIFLLWTHRDNVKRLLKGQEK